MQSYCCKPLTQLFSISLPCQQMLSPPLRHSAGTRPVTGMLQHAARHQEWPHNGRGKRHISQECHRWAQILDMLGCLLEAPLGQVHQSAAGSHIGCRAQRMLPQIVPEWVKMCERMFGHARQFYIRAHNVIDCKQNKYVGKALNEPFPHAGVAWHQFHHRSCQILHSGSADKQCLSQYS